MKTLALILLSGVLLISCQTKPDKTEQVSEPDTENILDENKTTVMLHIEGMTCTGCEKTITTGLESIPGVITATASHVDSTAVVQYDKSRVQIDDLRQMVEDKGYTYVSSSPAK